MEESLVPFLLYSAADADFVGWLRQQLGPSVAPADRWVERTYRPDEPLGREAPQAAGNGYDVMLVVLTDDNSDSPHVHQAVLSARRSGGTVVLLLLERLAIPESLRDLPSVDFSGGEWHHRLPILRRTLAERRRVVFLTPRPHVLPEDQFRDRTVEAESLTRQLFSHPVGVMVLSGPEGIGKTAMAARILHALGVGDASWPQWVLCLTADGSVPVSAVSLLELLSRVPMRDGVVDFAPLLGDTDLTPTDKLRTILQELEPSHVLVVIDNVEDLLDDSGDFLDADLGELLKTLASEVVHHVKVLLITRQEPHRLLRMAHGGAKPFPIHDGLELRDSAEVLRALDRDGRLGLRSADDHELSRIWALTGGNPRALEALYIILDRDRDTSLEELLSALERQGSQQQRMSYLGTMMFDGLGHTEQFLVRALAVFGRPVTPEAIDHLLEPYVRNYHSIRELRRLLGKRIVRAEGDHYYLPKTDRDRVLAGIEWGRAEDRLSPIPQETQLALLHRAANFFARARKDPEEVRGLDDLEPQLMEIHLRVAGEEYDEALDLLHKVDLRYLRPWGYSHLLVRERLQIDGNVSNRQAELANLDALGNATQQRDDLQEAKRYLSRAVTLAEELGVPDDLARSNIDLGDAYLQDAEPTQAAARFERALEKASEHQLWTEEAYARANLGICYGHMGRLDEALEQHERILEIIGQAKRPTPNGDDEEMATLEVQVLLSFGELLGRRGEPQAAVRHLARGRELARDLGLVLVEGELLSALAEIRIDEGNLGQAIKLAKEAVELGKPVRNPQLLQSAYSMLALAHLYGEDLTQAQAAAAAAARYPRRRWRLEPSVLGGVIALRNGDCDRARDSFNWVDQRATLQRKRDRHNVGVLDSHGLALCGLTVCGPGVHVEEAAAAFREARAARQAQVGVARRTVRLLDQMTRTDPAAPLDPARRAAAAF